MKIEKVLACAGLIGLALAFAFLFTGLGEGGQLFVLFGSTFLSFALACFAFIGIGRVAPPILKKLKKLAEPCDYGGRLASARDKYVDVKVDVPDVD